MTTIAARIGLCILTMGGLFGAYAAGSALGVATADGGFFVNDTQVNGNATLFDGSVIRTATAPSRLRMNDGLRIELATKSEATVRENRLVLAAGMTEVTAAGGYQIEAGGFRIEPTTPESGARVARAGRESVEVAALTGSLRVYNSLGLQVANVVPGAALSFAPQAGGGAPSNFLGCLLKKDGVFVLYDQTTRIIIELRGNQNFANEWGNRVQVIGTTDTSATSEVAAQVVDVTSLTRFGTGGCSPVAAAIAADLPEGAQAATSGPATATGGPPATPTPQPAPGGGGGMSGGTKVAIIAAVGGGAGAGIYFATKKDNNRSRD